MQHSRLLPRRARPLERPLYEENGQLSAADLHAEQRYRLERLMHHNRYSHGQGVVCGLQVVPARIATRPWALRVCPGYAIGCCGEEIELRSAALLDIREHLWNRPDQIGRVPPSAYVAIRYAEALAAPIPAPQAGCGCEETVYEHSRIRDGYRLDVLWALKTKPTARFDVCTPGIPTCPECRDNTHVLLARVTLPARDSDPITSTQIDNLSGRRRLFATAALQRQIVQCCCEEEGDP